MRFRSALAIVALAIVALTLARSAPLQFSADDSYWRAFHEKDLHRFAKKSGLSTAVLKELLRAVGREDDFDYYFGTVDARSLRSRGQVFLSIYDFGTGHGMTVYVVDIRTPYYRKVWEASGTAQTDFTTESVLGTPTGSVGPGGTIVVKLPIWNRQVPLARQNSELLVAKYVWNGKTYHLESERKYLRYKWNGRDWETPDG